nr:MAK10-like protein [Tanacetum cinerariifolium]
MDSLQGLTPESPSPWHRPLAPSLIFYDHVNLVTRRTIDQSAGGKLREHNAEESWELLEDLALYDNESWNDPRNFAKPVKAIALPQDVPITSDRHLIELETQVQRLMEAHLALTQPTQVNKSTTSCEICNGPHDTLYCMENPKQAFVDYASSRTNKAGGLLTWDSSSWLGWTVMALIELWMWAEHCGSSVGAEFSPHHLIIHHLSHDI